MKKYERLTMINNGFIDTNCRNCKQCKKVGRKYICNDMTACNEEIITRLCELENKIENGTLIDMPRIIHPNKAEWYVQYQYPSGVIQYYICFSEAEAKKKLKELNGE